MSRLIRVVVADDSAFIRSLIISYLEQDGKFDIAGVADNGQEAVDRVRDLRPDVVTLDVDMPVMSGLDALDQIMRETPTPAVMVSGVSRRAADTTLRAINGGAIDFILKYVPGANNRAEEIRLDVISKVRAAAGVRVVRTIASRLDLTRVPWVQGIDQRGVETPVPPQDRVSLVPSDLVVVGASTGGPIALKELLTNLPADFSVPIIVVQHIPAQFTEVLAAQLNSQTPFCARVVQGGETPQPRCIYIAPGDRHLLMSGGLTLETHDGPPIGGHRPSIDVTMKSVAQSFPHRIHGILLTGMGIDGASGLAFIRARSGTTYAQDAQSSVVFGMPKRAIEMEAVNHVASPRGIAEHLVIQLGKNYNRQPPADMVAVARS